MSGSLVPRSPASLADDLVALVAATLPARPLRVLLDGVGTADLADALLPGLAAAGRPGVRIPAEGFWRPAGERFEHGREDVEDFRTRWLDDAALDREVLSRPHAPLPALWDAARDRSARRTAAPVPAATVLLVDGVLLLGRGLPCDLAVHVALSPAALRRRGVPEWQLPAYADYDREVRPAQVCDVLVRAEDARRPALLVRRPPQMSR